MHINKKVLITGATSGIGEALVAQYSDHNHTVIACGRQAEKLSMLCQNNQASATLQFDITNEDQIKDAAAKVSELDIVIFNAGDCLYIDDVMAFDASLFAKIINTNLTSLGYLVKHFLPKINKGGQLVFISSIASQLPFPKTEAYGASKAGVDYFANCIRLDLISHDINVTLVHPGFIKTPLTDKNDFPMPFILTADEAATRIYQGVEARKNYLHFPKRLSLLLKLFRLLPNKVWQSIILRTS
jgi:short-subunit dehydrogenase